MNAHLVSVHDPRDLDRLASGGRPSSWVPLVESFRGLPRLIEPGTVVHIADRAALVPWSAFYSWAHGRQS